MLHPAWAAPIAGNKVDPRQLLTCLEDVVGGRIRALIEVLSKEAPFPALQSLSQTSLSLISASSAVGEPVALGSGTFSPLNNLQSVHTKP